MHPRLPQAANSIAPAGGPAPPQRHAWSPGARPTPRAPQLPPPAPPPPHHHYHTPAGAGIYDSPSEATATTREPSVSSGRGSAGSASLVRRLLRPSSSPRRRRPGRSGLRAGGDRLERAHRRMQAVFYVLVTACALVVAVYATLIVLLLGSAGGERDQDPSHCLPGDQVTEFENAWPEEKYAIFKMLDSYRASGDDGSGDGGGRVCFKSLLWVPWIMGRMKSKVEESVTYIEEQQNKLNQTLSAYTAVNRTDRQCPDTANQPVETGAKAADAVYAHYFLDTHVQYKYEEDVVKWVRDRQKMSSHNKINVSGSTGRFSVRYPGFYFVYAHLAFKGGASDLVVHRVVRTRSGVRQNLLEAGRGRVSYLQGVFTLLSGDVLTVEATVTKLDLSRHSVSYFGLYLIRT